MCRLRNMFNKAVEWELLDANPMERLKFLPENNARLRYLSMEECERLLASCLTPHMHAMATLALHTGMRLGEILNLCGHDLDFGSGHIIIRDSKNGQPRHVPMDSAVRDLLSGYIPSVGTSHVFPSASGGRLSTVQKAFRNARIRAGMPELHFHDLRHTFASQWMMNGGDLYVLKDILGHKSIAMTQRYAHLSPAFKQAMVERMEQMWRKPALAPSPTSVVRAKAAMRGHFKTGHMKWPGTQSLFILLSPDQASQFWFSSCAVRISGCARGGAGDPAWR